MHASTRYSGGRNRRIVLALVGDSTTTRRFIGNAVAGGEDDARRAGGAARRNGGSYNRGVPPVVPTRRGPRPHGSLRGRVREPPCGRAQWVRVIRPVCTSFPTVRWYTYVPAARPDASSVAPCVPASRWPSASTATSRPSTSYTASRTSADAATSYVITACRANGFGDTTAGAVEAAAAKKSPPSTVASNVAPPPAMAVGAETWIVKRAVSQTSSG